MRRWLVAAWKARRTKEAPPGAGPAGPLTSDHFTRHPRFRRAVISDRTDWAWSSSMQFGHDAPGNESRRYRNSRDVPWYSGVRTSNTLTPSLRYKGSQFSVGGPATRHSHSTRNGGSNPSRRRPPRSFPRRAWVLSTASAFVGWNSLYVCHSRLVIYVRLVGRSRPALFLGGNSWDSWECNSLFFTPARSCAMRRQTPSTTMRRQTRILMFLVRITSTDLKRCANEYIRKS